MNVGVKGGLLVGAEYGVLCYWAPQPLGAIAFWFIQTVHLTTYSIVMWHRTRLVLSTLGGAAATLASGLLLRLHVVGYTWETIPMAWAVPLYGLIALVPACVLGESCLHRGEWAEWRQQAEGMGLWDTLLMRHIPTLTKRDA